MYDSGRKQAEAIWRAGVAAVQPSHCIPAELEQLRKTCGNWSPQRRYLVIGGGKAGAAMAQATERFLLQQRIPPSHITGWVNVPEGSSPDKLQCIHLHPARPPGFNFPTPEAVAGTEAMLKLLDDAPSDVIVLCLISGGGSAILCAPTVPLEDKLNVSKQLSGAGASIRELNTVRKHLSHFKGGQLAARCFANHPTRQLISLIISDVIGDPLDVIASGPTAVDPTTFHSAMLVLRQKKLLEKVPGSVMDYLQAGVVGMKPETLKAAPAPEPQLLHRLVASNQKAIDAAARHAEKLGYQVIEYADQREHDTLTQAAYFADQVISQDRQQPLCLISGGESTVKLPSNPGKGGRNQSFALAFLLQLDALLHHDRKAWKGITALFAGTDGEDGPTDAAGAFADSAVLDAAKKMQLTPQTSLDNHDAYPFFDATKSLFRTGLTETNVMDLRVILLNAQ